MHRRSRACGCDLLVDGRRPNHIRLADDHLNRQSSRQAAISARMSPVDNNGASTPLATEHSDTCYYAAALDAWLGALWIDRCHVLGHSLGC
jgi:hypothetical protein